MQGDFGGISWRRGVVWRRNRGKFAGSRGYLCVTGGALNENRLSPHQLALGLKSQCGFTILIEVDQLPTAK